MSIRRLDITAMSCVQNTNAHTGFFSCYDKVEQYSTARSTVVVAVCYSTIATTYSTSKGNKETDTREHSDATPLAAAPQNIERVNAINTFFQIQYPKPTPYVKS